MDTQHHSAASRQRAPRFEQLTLFDVAAYRVPARTPVTQARQRSVRPPLPPTPPISGITADGAYLTPDGLGALLGCSAATVKRRAQAGTWPSTHVGKLLRFSPANVRAIRLLLEGDQAGSW